MRYWWKVALALVLAFVAGCGSSEARSDDAAAPTSTSTTSTTTTVQPTAAVVLAWQEGEGETRALDVDGRRVRLPDWTSALSPDGHHAVFHRTVDPARMSVPWVLDLATGEEHPLGTVGAVAFAPDGRLAKGAENGPGASDVTIYSASTYEPVGHVVLGQQPEVPGVWALAWDADGKSLLAVAWDTEDRMQWWWVDVAAGTSRRLQVAHDIDVSQHMLLDVEPATAPGDFPILAGRGWGTLHVVADGTTSFTKGTPHGLTLPPGTMQVIPVGRRTIAVAPDQTFRLEPSDEDGYVLAILDDGMTHSYVLVTASGRSAAFPPEVDHVMAPRNDT